MDDLQALVDTYDAYYNDEREHQGLPAGTTPREAWEATATAPPPALPVVEPPPPIDAQRTSRHIAGAMGTIYYERGRCALGKRFTGDTIHFVSDSVFVAFYDNFGIEIITHRRPPDGTRYVGNNEPRGFMARYEPSTKP